jgi:HEAT repeat protein
MKRVIKNKKDMTKKYSKEMMHEYITALGSKNGMERQKARLALVAIGEPAIDILAELSIHPQLIIRWEAVKALSQIKDSVTAPLLINALEDEYEAIRWLAAEGLIALGKPGLISLLQALTSYRLTIFVREGAHHVINQLAKRYTLPGLTELLDILENSSNYLNIPIYSKLVLAALVNDNHNFKDSSLQ